MNEQPNVNLATNINKRTNDGKTIDLINLFGHIIIKWKAILVISLIISALTGVVIKATDATKSREVEKNAEEVYDTEEEAKKEASLPMEELVKRAASKLTEEQKAKADERYSQILEYNQVIERQEELNEASYLMSLDPDTAVSYFMQYLAETDVNNATGVYNAYILSESDYDKISELLGADIGKKALNEGIKISTSTSDTDPSFKMDLERSDRLAGDVESRLKLIVTVNIYAPDKGSCEGIAKIIDDAIAKKTKLLKDKGAFAECKMIDDGYYINAKQSIIDAIKDRNSQKVSLVNGRPGYTKSLLDDLNPEEVEYINRLRGIRPEVKKEEKKEDVTEEETPPKSVLFYLVIGFLSGMFLSICGYSAVYITAGKVRTGADLAFDPSIPVLQTLSTEKFKNDCLKGDLITKWGRKLSEANINKQDPFAVIAEELVGVFKRDDIGHIYVAIDRSSDQADVVANKLTESLSGDASFTVGGIEPDPTDMKNIMSSDGMIVVPFLDNTRIKNICSITDMSRRNRKNIIGYLPVRNIVRI